MANYNTFIIQDIKSRKTLLVTSSARKAWSEFSKGKSVEVWNDNKRLERITSMDLKKERHPLLPYVQKERDYIRAKQEAAERRNRKRCNYESISCLRGIAKSMYGLS